MRFFAMPSGGQAMSDQNDGIVYHEDGSVTIAVPPAEGLGDIFKKEN